MKKPFFYILIMLLTFACISSCTTKSILSQDIYIFEDITECQQLLNELPDVNTKEYESPDKDNKLKNLKYSRFYSATFSTEDYAFDLFAYEFNSKMDAEIYFKNVTGKSDIPNPNFGTSIGAGQYRLIVIDGTNAYTVYCSKNSAERVLLLLKETFTKQLIFSENQGAN